MAPDVIAKQVRAHCAADRVTPQAPQHVFVDSSAIAIQLLSASRLEKQGETYSVLALPQAKLAGLIFDVDNTLYNNNAYRLDVERKELTAIAKAMGWDKGAAPYLLRRSRDQLTKYLGRPARLTETIASLNLPTSWWNDTREEIYGPEEFLKASPIISQTFRAALDRDVRVAVATNSPSGVARRILHILGVDESIIRRLYIVGPDTLGSAKPDPNYFRRIIDIMHISPEQCLSIGDDEQNDGIPAMTIGMGAAIVSRADQIEQLVYDMTNDDAFKPFDLERFAKEQYKPNVVSVIGLTGRAGAGKTTLAKKLSTIYKRHNIPSAEVNLDCFFKLSSAKRNEWLEDGRKLNELEYKRRVDQINWWDFRKLEKTLDDIRARKAVRMEGVYDRKDKGELTGVLNIDPQEIDRSGAGIVCIIEGVAILHLKKKDDHCMCVTVHPKVRVERLLVRDKRLAAAAKERLMITQTFEDRYVGEYADRIDVVIQNCNGTLLRAPIIPHM